MYTLIAGIELSASELEFVEQYMDTAVFADPPEEELFVNADDVVTCPAWEREAVIDCLHFHSKYEMYLSDEMLEQAAHDLYLSRNGHGIGFWDNYKENKYPDWLASKMQQTAESMGEHQVQYEENADDR